MRRFGIFGIWLLVVMGATMVTWQIVSAADNQVSDRPVAPLNVAAPQLTNPGSTTTEPTAPSTSSTTTTATTGTGSSTPTTAGSSTPTTTASTSPPSQWASRSIQTPGGTVIVRYRPGEVEYQSATPAPGFQVEVDDAGPPEVKMEFESESAKYEVEARWEDGGLEVKTSGSSEDGA